MACYGAASTTILQEGDVGDFLIMVLTGRMDVPQGRRHGRKQGRRPHPARRHPRRNVADRRPAPLRHLPHAANPPISPYSAARPSTKSSSTTPARQQAPAHPPPADGAAPARSHHADAAHAGQRRHLKSMQRPQTIGLIGIALLMGAGTARRRPGHAQPHRRRLADARRQPLPAVVRRQPQALLGTSQKSDTIRVTTVGLKFARTTRCNASSSKPASSTTATRPSTTSTSPPATTPPPGAGPDAAPQGNFTRNRTKPSTASPTTTTTNRTSAPRHHTRFAATSELGAAMHLIAGVAQNRNTNSKIFLAEGALPDSADFGLRYVFRSGASVSLVRRQGAAATSPTATSRSPPASTTTASTRTTPNCAPSGLSPPRPGQGRIAIPNASTTTTPSATTTAPSAASASTGASPPRPASPPPSRASWSATDALQQLLPGRPLRHRPLLADQRQDRPAPALRLQRARLPRRHRRHQLQRPDRHHQLGSIAFEWAPYSNTLISASLQNEKAQLRTNRGRITTAPWARFPRRSLSDALLHQITAVSAPKPVLI